MSKFVARLFCLVGFHDWCRPSQLDGGKRLWVCMTCYKAVER